MCASNVIKYHSHIYCFSLEDIFKRSFTFLNFEVNYTYGYILLTNNIHDVQTILSF